MAYAKLSRALFRLHRRCPEALALCQAHAEKETRKAIAALRQLEALNGEEA